jgi:hypothetical protein
MFNFLVIVLPVESPFNKIVFFFRANPSKIDISLLILKVRQYFATFFIFKGITD